MEFGGYWVSVDSGKAFLERATFDETDLDPATNWKQAWQNQDSDSLVKGYVDLDAALLSAATLLASGVGRILSQSEVNQARHFDPVWQGDRCEIAALTQMIN